MCVFCVGVSACYRALVCSVTVQKITVNDRNNYGGKNGMTFLCFFIFVRGFKNTEIGFCVPAVMSRRLFSAVG